MMNQIHIQYYKTSIGELILGAYDHKLCLLDFRYRKMRTVVDGRIKQILNAVFVEKDDIFFVDVRKQIDEYLSGSREDFNLPILLLGSAFQKQVWNALMDVGFGKTASYLQLARSINNEKAVRAVAAANGANALALIIPCHRVIGSNGELVGYGGGLSVKRKLLNLEKGITTEHQLTLDF